MPPLCDPSTSTGDPTGQAQGLTVDATILALNQSFVVNNYAIQNSGPGLGTLYVYGSIQQDARGPGGTGLAATTATYKYYYWDARLPLYGPPYYLTPGTPSWSLDSSAESYTGPVSVLCRQPPRPCSTALRSPQPLERSLTSLSSANDPPVPQPGQPGSQCRRPMGDRPDSELLTRGSAHRRPDWA